MGWKPSKLLSLLSSCSGMHAGELWKDQMLKAATGHFEIWPTSNFPSLRGSRTHPWSYLQPPDSCSSRLCSDRLAPASQRQRADIKLLSAFVLIGLNSEQMKVIGEGGGVHVRTCKRFIINLVTKRGNLSWVEVWCHDKRWSLCIHVDNYTLLWTFWHQDSKRSFTDWFDSWTPDLTFRFVLLLFGFMFLLWNHIFL